MKDNGCKRKARSRLPTHNSGPWELVHSISTSYSAGNIGCFPTFNQHLAAPTGNLPVLPVLARTLIPTIPWS